MHAFFSFPKRKEHPDKLFCPHDALLPCRLFAYLNDIARGALFFPRQNSAQHIYFTDDPVGQEQDNQADQDTKHQDVGRTQRGPEHFAQDNINSRPDGGAPGRGDAPEHHHHNHHYRDVGKVEYNIGVDKSNVVHVKGSRQPGEKGAGQQSIVLVQGGGYAQRGGGVLVFPDGNQVIAYFRVYNVVSNPDGQQQGGQSHIVVKHLRGYSGHDQYALGAVGKGQVDEQQPENLTQRQHSQRKIRASQAKSNHTNGQGNNNCGNRAEQHAPPGGNAHMELQEPRRVGPHPEEGGVAKGNLAGITAQKVPGGPDNRPDKNQDDYVQLVRGFDYQRQNNSYN
ncbi:hypothetical protein Psfp_02389 [Pelotomaculum sp. FP]|nr:hypothetical protein Psfp_02389 [Pelotomaculum sp. FP]